ncbi:MAG: hypothetical protein IK031_01460 [Bacteroidales bacterium]|nr:hypothetical protein [Bacteroidales bacterium]
MKKIIVILAAILAFGMTASAQRQYVGYATAGILTHINDTYDIHPGIDIAGGVRNYNRDAFVSFAYGAEAFAFWLPSADSSDFGIYAIPQIGVAIGPKGFKVYPHSGFMAGYSKNIGTFNLGSNGGIALDFGKNITLDFVGYYIFNQAWSTAVNVTWRF